jgi:hypothetical protein
MKKHIDSNALKVGIMYQVKQITRSWRKSVMVNKGEDKNNVIGTHPNLRMITQVRTTTVPEIAKRTVRK